MARSFAVFFAAFLASSPGCRRASSEASPGDAQPPRESGSPAAVGEVGLDALHSLHGLDKEAAAPLPPIPPQPALAELPVPTFPNAVVSLPNGATSSRPILLVFHADDEQSERACETWRAITKARGFVVCPRDQDDVQPQPAHRDRFARRGGVSLRSFVVAVLESLEAQYRGYVDGQRPLVVGSSTVSDELARLAADDPRRFPRVVFLEGGAGAWTKERIHAFHWEGGDRVLFACATAACLTDAKAAAVRLDRSGVESHAVHVDAHRTDDTALREIIGGEMGWLLGDDPRWTGAGK